MFGLVTLMMVLVALICAVGRRVTGRATEVPGSPPNQPMVARCDPSLTWSKLAFG